MASSAPLPVSQSGTRTCDVHGSIAQLTVRLGWTEVRVQLTRDAVLACVYVCSSASRAHSRVPACMRRHQRRAHANANAAQTPAARQPGSIRMQTCLRWRMGCIAACGRRDQRRRAGCPGEVLRVPRHGAARVDAKTAAGGARRAVYRRLGPFFFFAGVRRGGVLPLRPAARHAAASSERRAAAGASMPAAGAAAAPQRPSAPSKHKLTSRESCAVVAAEVSNARGPSEAGARGGRGRRGQAVGDSGNVEETDAEGGAERERECVWGGKGAREATGRCAAASAFAFARRWRDDARGPLERPVGRAFRRPSRRSKRIERTIEHAAHMEDTALGRPSKDYRRGHPADYR